MGTKQIVQAVNHTSVKHSQYQRDQSINFLKLEDTKTAIACEAQTEEASRTEVSRTEEESRTEVSRTKEVSRAEVSRTEETLTIKEVPRRAEVSRTKKAEVSRTMKTSRKRKLSSTVEEANVLEVPCTVGTI